MKTASITLNNIIRRLGFDHRNEQPKIAQWIKSHQLSVTGASDQQVIELYLQQKANPLAEIKKDVLSTLESRLGKYAQRLVLAGSGSMGLNLFNVSDFDYLIYFEDNYEIA